MDNGELFAMMVLVHLMLTLFADNRDTLELQDLILSLCKHYIIYVYKKSGLLQAYNNNGAMFVKFIQTHEV